MFWELAASLSGAQPDSISKSRIWTLTIWILQLSRWLLISFLYRSQLNTFYIEWKFWEKLVWSPGHYICTSNNWSWIMMPHKFLPLRRLKLAPLCLQWRWSWKNLNLKLMHCFSLVKQNYETYKARRPPLVDLFPPIKSLRNLIFLGSSSKKARFLRALYESGREFKYNPRDSSLACALKAYWPSWKCRFWSSWENNRWKGLFKSRDVHKERN